VTEDHASPAAMLRRTVKEAKTKAPMMTSGGPCAVGARPRFVHAAACGDAAGGDCRTALWPVPEGRDAGPGCVNSPARSVCGGLPRDLSPATPAGGVAALEDDIWWDLPGDLGRSMDDAAFRGSDLCSTIALRTPARRMLPIPAGDRIATRDAWLARIPTSVRARIRRGGIARKVAYANARGRACPRVAVLGDPFPLLQDATVQGDEACRFVHHLTKQTMRRGPLIQGVEHRWSRQQDALAQIHTTDPALGPRYRLQADLRTLIHASHLTTAKATTGPCRSADGGPRGWRAGN